MSQIMEKALTPEEWSLKLERRGVLLSPRTIRSKAREYGQFYSLGRMILLLPEQIDEMLRLEAKESQNKCQKTIQTLRGERE